MNFGGLLILTICSAAFGAAGAEWIWLGFGNSRRCPPPDFEIFAFFFKTALVAFTSTVFEWEVLTLAPLESAFRFFEATADFLDEAETEISRTEKTKTKSICLLARQAFSSFLALRRLRSEGHWHGEARGSPQSAR